MNRRMLFLGTGNGMPTTSSCSCVLIEDDTHNFLFDAGGGHDILVQFAKAKVDPTIIKNIFISHYDSDHILGIVPLARAFRRWAKPQPRTIFCSEEVQKAIESLFMYVAKNHFEQIKSTFNFIIVKDGTNHAIGKWKLHFFDVKSPGTPQLGCIITFSDKTKLAFLGDEPLREHAFNDIQGSNIMIHNAFCLDTEEHLFKAHEKNHSTVKEAAEMATKMKAKNLVLLHMEDKTLATRKKKYTKEVKEYFSGKVFVPVDLDSLNF